MIDTGRHPHMGFEPNQPRLKLESINKFADRIAKGLEEVKLAITKVKDEHAMYYNRRREPTPIFAPETGSGSMEATSPPIDHPRNCPTVTWAPL
jgi:hypothetical protein